MSIKQNYSVYANTSRATHYRYLKTEPLFADSMATAQDNANEVSFSFRTYP